MKLKEREGTGGRGVDGRGYTREQGLHMQQEPDVKGWMTIVLDMTFKLRAQH